MDIQHLTSTDNISGAELLPFVSVALQAPPLDAQSLTLSEMMVVVDVVVEVAVDVRWTPSK